MSAVASPAPSRPLHRLAARARALPRSAALALGGIALVAVHVADDRFIQPQPGTGAGDHLVSGLVPLGLLGLAAWAYPRVRAGAQAVLALVLGLFALIVSVEAVYYALDGSTSGDDYTGFAAIPAGLLLLAVGIGTLWRSRRRDAGLRRRYARRGAIALAGVVAFIYGVFPLGVAHISTHIGRTVVERVDLGPDVEKVTFTTSDGLTLRGSYIPSTNGAAVIAAPGYNDAPAHARMLARHGYGVLLFDQRGEGASDGDPNALGWTAEKDMRAAIAFLQRQTDVDPERIGGLGLSVAGESLLQTAAHTDELRAVVSEGAGARSHREWRDMPGLNMWLGLPFQVSAAAQMAVFTDALPPEHLRDLVAEIEQPVLLIYSKRGVDTERLNRDFYEAARGEKTLWEVSDGGHTQALQTRPKEYERRVVGFLDEALLGR